MQGMLLITVVSAMKSVGSWNFSYPDGLFVPTRLPYLLTRFQGDFFDLFIETYIFSALN